MNKRWNLSTRQLIVLWLSAVVLGCSVGGLFGFLLSGREWTLERLAVPVCLALAMLFNSLSIVRQSKSN